MLIFMPLLLQKFTSGKFEATGIVWLALIFKALCLWAVIIVIPATQYLYARNRHRLVVISNVATSAATFLLSLLLTPRLNIAGVALAALIPATIKAHCFMLPRVREGLDISMREYGGQVLTSLLPALTLHIVLLFMLKSLCDHAPFPLLVGGLGGLAVSVLSALLWFQQTATPYERTIFRDLLGKIRRKPALTPITEMGD
jgi:peptidoglycan biosynthesis protein MviN/MurJ (putative lipid II flippase)